MLWTALRKEFTDLGVLSFIHSYSMSYFYCSSYTISRRRKAWGLLSTRKQGHTVETIADYVRAIKERFPNMGSRTLTATLRMQHKIKVPECVFNTI